MLRPPWLVNYKSSIYNDTDTADAWAKHELWIREVARVLKPNAHAWLFLPAKKFHKWIALVENYLLYNNVMATDTHHHGMYVVPNDLNNQLQLVAFCSKEEARNLNPMTFVPGEDDWIRPNDLFPEVQLIAYCSKDKARDFNHVDWIPTSEEWFNDARNTMVKPFTYLYPNFINNKLIKSNIKANAQIKKHHPNEKNPEFIRNLILMSTQPGEIVLDPFSGSGSNAIAAIRAGRRYLGFEQNAEMVEIARAWIAEEQTKKTEEVREQQITARSTLNQWL
jgi:DNA modification methylase